MKNITIFILVISLIISFSSCSPSAPRGKQPYIGGFGEAMVVCENAFWNSNYANDTLKVLLTEYVPAAMPAQQQLDITHIDPKYFKRGSALNLRKVLVIEVRDDVKGKEPSISFTTGEHAKDQLIIYVRAKTEREIKQLLNQGAPEILRRINEKEVQRKIQALKLNSKSDEERNIKEKKGYDIVVPLKYTVLIDSGNVLWMTKVTSRDKKEYNDQRFSDVVVTTYPYTSEKDFELENILSKRDSVLKKLSYNPEKGTYKRFQEKCDPTVNILGSETEYAVEVRSMWTTEGKFQGGPSVQYVLLDYEKGRIIHADARVYAPNASKREMIREVEAIIKSINP